MQQFVARVEPDERGGRDWLSKHIRCSFVMVAAYCGSTTDYQSGDGNKLTLVRKMTFEQGGANSGSCVRLLPVAVSAPR